MEMRSKSATELYTSKVGRSEVKRDVIYEEIFLSEASASV